MKKNEKEKNYNEKRWNEKKRREKKSFNFFKKKHFFVIINNNWFYLPGISGAAIAALGIESSTGASARVWRMPPFL